MTSLQAFALYYSIHINQTSRENVMGLFLDDKKPPEPKPRVAQQAQWWPAAILILVLTGIGVVLWWIFKPLLTFEGKSKNQVKTQILILMILILGPLATLYILSPSVRDLVTLSKTHTLNHSRYGGRIFFPERENFKIEGVRRGITVGSKTYITYAGYTENVIQKMRPNECQMVTRSGRIGLASINQPEAAEGFIDEVKYQTVQRIGTLTGYEYAKEFFVRPRYWFSKEELETITVEIERTSSWKQFINDWDLIWKFDSGYRAFELKALSSEHAAACF